MDYAHAALRAEALRQEIWQHRYRYYVLAQPTLEDAEYDALEHELLEIERRFPDLATDDSPTRRVGHAVTGEMPAVAHRVPMLSLENAYSIEELREWNARLVRAADLPSDAALAYSCEHKIDGVSVSVIYENGVLVRAVSRGDGRVGEDITASLRTIRSIPLRLNPPFVALEARGEVYFPTRDFREFNDEREEEGLTPFANPRNAAAGTLRIQDPAVVAKRPLDVFFWQLLGTAGREPDSQAEGLRLLREAGLRTNPHGAAVAGLEAVIAYIEQWSTQKRELEYEVDGIVVKADDRVVRDRAGATSKARAGPSPSSTRRSARRLS
ncbi:MAG: hypothetical protein HC882_07850 [Acidobacteria bacterium]|nr:hypothetical protein [Acidobacteriota bacterium]